ncbi:uncharacterized protein LOC132553365 [Ylistrum balloti]|uniref:uncharacterized protein LOC132553365 n=1 Tax=Ylistrum balloti TaxID=509963 RepID=UPI002905D64D|nr:uncharacterized protein LOC132553365 [Ylistrum balloti]
MSSLQELLKTGSALGLQGSELRDFILDEQNREREERKLDREEKRTEAERQHQLVLLKGKRDEMALQLSLEKEREERAVKIELLEYQKTQGANPTGSADQKMSHGLVKGPKLPPYEEGKDNIDSYLQRFERYAIAQHWDRDSQWATNLSALLKGNALDVFSRLPVEKSLNYDTLKEALLKRFEMTEEGFRQRFRTGRPDSGETLTQFSVRLDNYFVRWLELAKAEKTYDGLKDLMLRDQFLQICGSELRLFLKERIPKSMAEMAKLADQFADARGNPSNLVKAKHTGHKQYQGNRSPGDFTKSVGKRDEPKGKVISGSNLGGKTCYICKKTDHLSYNCPASTKKKQSRVGLVADSDAQEAAQIEGIRKHRSSGKKTGNPPSCGALSSSEDDNDERDPDQLSISCSAPVLDSGMPVVRGLIGKHVVTVLRDTGCSGVVIRRSLVDAEDFTGDTKMCTLADGSKLKVDTANVVVDTPYYQGTVMAWCMDTPIYDLILGNIHGIRSPGDPNPKWNLEEQVSAVQTRAQKAAEETPYRPLKVPKVFQEINPIDFKDAQISDGTLAKIREMAVSGEVKERRDGGKPHFFTRNGLVYREYKSPSTQQGRIFKQLVVPSTYRQKVMGLAHDSMMAGHLGAKRTSDRIMAEFYWPGAQSDVTRYCRSCDVCQRTFPKGRVTKVPLGMMPLIDAPFQRVAIDIVGPLQPATDRGNRFILTIVDYATRYPEAVALKGIETERVAEALVDVYSRVGVPKEVLTDQGSQFTSSVMREVSRLLSIRQLTTTPYHPMCNGLVERYNGTLKQMLRRMCSERPKDWDKYLNALLFSYREVPQESLGFSPFELLYGRVVRGPMMILRELCEKEVADPEVKSTYQYVLDLRERLEETCKLAQEQLRKAKVTQAKFYNRKAKNRVMEPGEKVLVLLPTKRNKIQMQWRGPYGIVERKGPMDYVVSVDGREKVLHANLLRRYVQREGTGLSEAGVLNAVCSSVIEGDSGGIEEELPSTDCFNIPTPVRTETVEDVQVSELLTSKQKVEMKTLLEEFSDVLSDVPGRTNLVVHDIRTTTNEPVRAKNYPIPYNLKETIREEVEKMLKMRVIEKSDAPYAAPVVIVRKKDGTNRFCIDYRQLNRVTIFDAEPMPNADDIFSRLSGNRYFSRLDLSKGYWQVPMEETSKQKTAFTTPIGLFQFSVMSFGLVNAPATFCRLMRILLESMKNIESFIDDILIYTKTWEEHLAILRELFVRLRKAMITARPTKCALGFESLECLGHMIGQQLLQPNPDKVKAILEAKIPKTKKQVRSFIGLAGFYRKFVPNFATIAAPLTDLTRKGQPNAVIWKEPQDLAFKTLKKVLSTSPVLKLPDLNSEFILRTDASDNGIGAILLQEVDGVVHPVAYMSRKLKGGEVSYSVVEKECLAVVWGISKFQKYLYGRQFVLETDHQPLLYLNKSKGTNARLMRWALQLQPHRFRIQPIKGTDNVGADFLSRV